MRYRERGVTLAVGGRRGLHGSRVGWAGIVMPIMTREREEVEQPQLASVWAKIRGLLQAEVGEAEYRNWLRPMTLSGLFGDEIAISLPTGFVRDWVRDHHGARVNALWQAACPKVRRVDFVVRDPAHPVIRSEERRVGKECRSRWSPYH